MTATSQQGTASKMSQLLQRGWFYPLLTVALAVLASLVRIVVNRRFFYWDDTQTGAYGVWFELGNRILSGELTILNPSAWQAGNYLAEGQWSLLNPLVLLIGLGSHATDNAALYSTLVKLFFIGAMALGVYLLSRSFGASPSWSMVAGFAAPLAGLTSYIDAPSWVTGLMQTALLPLAWWALRRILVEGRGALPFLLFAYLLVTVGYVYGVIMLAVVLGATLVDRLAVRDWKQARLVLVASVYSGLLAIAIFLPGLLTAPVTERGGFAILDNSFFNADLSDLAGAASPGSLVSVEGWWGRLAPAPVQYVAWFLPFLAIVWRVNREVVRRLVPLFAVLAFSLMLVLGPSDIGPLRYFARMMPYVSVAILVVFAVLATAAFPRRLSRGQAILVAVITALGAWFAFAEAPTQVPTLVFLAGQLVAIGVIYWVLSSERFRRFDAFRPQLAAGCIAAATLLVVLPQAATLRTSALGDFKVPTSVADMKLPLQGAPNDVITVGDSYRLAETPEAYAEALIANLWYVNGHRVANTYTVLPFSAYARDLCIDLRGATCPDLFQTLFSEDPLTDLPVVDLLATNTVLVLKSSIPDTWPAPDGWRIERDGAHTVLYVREDPVLRAGGVVWESDETAVTTVSQSDTSVSLRVDSVPEEGGTVVLSRLAWPGYSVSNAAFGNEVRDYLMSVQIPAASIGEVVHIEFRPPGWPIEVASFLLAVGILITWPVLQLTKTRRYALRRNDSEQPVTIPNRNISGVLDRRRDAGAVESPL